MTNPVVEKSWQKMATRRALLQRLKRFCTQPRNRAGIVTAVVLAAPVLIFQAAIEHDHAPIAIDAAPALIVAFLLGRSVKVEPGQARSDEIGMLAYMPLAVASIAFLLVPEFFANVDDQPPHMLDSFYTAAAGVLAALLIALMIESHRLFHVDPQLRALRSWWIASVVMGILAALTGLTPDHTAIARETAFQATWSGLAGAITAGALVMSRDYLAQLAERTSYTPGVDAEKSTENANIAGH